MYKKHDARAELLFWLLGHVHSSPDIFELQIFETNRPLHETSETAHRNSIRLKPRSKVV